MLVLHLNVRHIRLLPQVLHRTPWCQLNKVENPVVLYEIVLITPIQSRDNSVREYGIGQEVQSVRPEISTCQKQKKVMSRAVVRRHLRVM